MLWVWVCERFRGFGVSSFGVKFRACLVKSLRGRLISKIKEAMHTIWNMRCSRCLSLMIQNVNCVVVSRFMGIRPCQSRGMGESVPGL